MATPTHLQGAWSLWGETNQVTGAPGRLQAESKFRCPLTLRLSGVEFCVSSPNIRVLLGMLVTPKDLANHDFSDKHNQHTPTPT